MDVLAMSPEAAQAEARRRAERRALGLPLTHELPELDRVELKRIAESDDRAEKEIQREIYQIYRAHGCELYWLSQARATRQTAGVPDLIVFHSRTRSAWYHEVKTPAGDQSLGQVVFAELCTAVGWKYVLGGIASAAEQLRAIGLNPPEVADRMDRP